MYESLRGNHCVRVIYNAISITDSVADESASTLAVPQWQYLYINLQE